MVGRYYLIFYFSLLYINQWTPPNTFSFNASWGHRGARADFTQWLENQIWSGVAVVDEIGDDNDGDDDDGDDDGDNDDDNDDDGGDDEGDDGDDNDDDYDNVSHILPTFIPW